MPPNTMNTLNAPDRGDLIFVRRAPSSGSPSQMSVLLIWDVPVPYHGVRATTSNLRAVDVRLFLPHQPTDRFLNTDLGHRITSASTAEDAANNFRAAIDIEAYNLRTSFFDSHAYPLAAFLDQNSTFSCDPQQKPLGRCPNGLCENGLVAATHRAAVYQRYDLSTLTLAGNGSHLPMVCPACIPKNVAIESEKFFLVALRLDAGVRVTNEELDGMRANQARLDDARLEAGYQKIKVCPDVVWNVIAHGRSGWIVRHQGRWLQKMQRLSPRGAMGTNNSPTTVEEPVVESFRMGQMTSEGTHHSTSFPRRTFGQLQDAISQAICSICLADSYKTSDDVVILPCVHFFHEECITAWLRRHSSCPECRQLVSAP